MNQNFAPPSESIPFKFRCSLTGLLMRNPVEASDNYCYDKGSIEMWMKYLPYSPITSKIMANNKLTVREDLKEGILNLHYN